MAATGARQQQPAAAPAASAVDPKFELTEKAGSYVLRIALQGFRKDDFRVQVDGAGRLTVRGAGRGSSLHKVFQLPAAASLDDIAGRFQAGVLTLTVPKRAPPTSVEEIKKSKPGVAKEESAAKPTPPAEVDAAKSMPAKPPTPPAEVDAAKSMPAKPPTPPAEVDGAKSMPAKPPTPPAEVDAAKSMPAKPPTPPAEVDGAKSMPAKPARPAAVDGAKSMPAKPTPPTAVDGAKSMPAKPAPPPAEVDGAKSMPAKPTPPTAVDGAKSMPAKPARPAEVDGAKKMSKEEGAAKPPPLASHQLPSKGSGAGKKETDGAKQPATGDDGGEKKEEAVVGTEPKESTLGRTTRQVAEHVQRMEEDSRRKEIEHKPAPASAAKKEQEPKSKAPQAAAAPEKPAPKPTSGEVDKESLAETVKRQCEEEKAAATAMETKAERAKKAVASTCVAWKERIAGELKGLSDMKWADNAVEMARKNKEVIAVGVAAFSIGFLVSHKLFRK